MKIKDNNKLIEEAILLDLDIIKFEFNKEIDKLLKLYFNYKSAIQLEVELLSPLKYPKLFKNIFKFKEKPTEVIYTYENINNVLGKETNEDIINKFGKNYESLLENLFLSHIYNLWEHKYRPIFAKLNCVDPDDIKINIFGELMKLRHSINHNNQIAKKKINLDSISISKDQKINFPRSEFVDIIIQIKREIKLYNYI